MRGAVRIRILPVAHSAVALPRFLVTGTEVREVGFLGHVVAVGSAGTGAVVPAGAAGAGVEGDFGCAHGGCGV